MSVPTNVRALATGLAILGVAAALAVGPAGPDAAGPDAGGGDQAWKSFHLTLRSPDDGRVLFSTRPDLEGALVDRHRDLGAEEPDGPVNGNYSRWPSVLRGLTPLLRELPPGGHLELDRHRLDEAATNRTRIPASASLPASGTMPRTEARDLWGASREGSLRMYLGAIPVQIAGVGDGTVDYEILVDELPDRMEIPRTRGLHVDVEPLGDRVSFRLEAPSGAFHAESRCNAVTATVDAGLHEVVARRDGALVLTSYENGLDHALDGRLVDLTLDAQPNATRSNDDANHDIPGNGPSADHDRRRHLGDRSPLAP